jgi:hypothetical protein
LTTAVDERGGMVSTLSQESAGDAGTLQVAEGLSDMKRRRPLAAGR